MIYNFPVVTAGTNLDSDTIGELAQHPNIVGTKLSCADVGKLHRLTSTVPLSKFATFPGGSAVFLQCLVTGGAGIISALTNIAPKTHVEVLRLYRAGKLEEAVKIQALLGQAEWEMAKKGSISTIKAVCARHFGYGNTRVRGPLSGIDLEAISGGPLDELVAFEKSL